LTDEAAGERRRLMAKRARLHKQAKALHAADKKIEGSAVDDRVDAIRARYRELLPDVTVACCSRTGEVVRWPIDTMGLDAWFWNYLVTCAPHAGTAAARLDRDGRRDAAHRSGGAPAVRRRPRSRRAVRGATHPGCRGCAGGDRRSASRRAHQLGDQLLRHTTGGRDVGQ
jgi:hypothetical protein